MDDRASTQAVPLPLAGHQLDLQAGTLRDGRGTVVAMRPQAWALLELLARHAGQVVTKDQILQAVWPGLVVTDGSIAQAVKDLRAAFGDRGRDVVQTVSRRGYRLVASGASTAVISETRQQLPLPPERLFGRDAELGELLQLIARHRLITVLGAGGIGKTAFALAAAYRHVAHDRQQVAWIDLAGVDEPAWLPATLARGLGLPVSQGDDPLQGVLSALKPLQALVVLDNAEHLVEPVARLAMAALSAAPALRVLVTSQAPLRLERERIFRLSALRVPAEDEPFDEVASAPSVALFADRAQAADHRFALTPANLSRVVGLCRRLDGLPLALRLAAGRVHLLGLSGLEAHMEDRLQWLAGETRDAPTRQQTLAAAIDWSYSLLAAPEQRLYRRLGVFVGGFTAEIAGALGGGTAADLQGLVERSMVDVELREPPRLRLLESQREHALRELARAGEIGDLRAHHARAIGEAMQAAARAYWSTPDATWLPMWAPELDNVRAALKWSEQHDRALCALLVGVSAPMFRLMGLAAELRRQADRLGEMPDLESGAATAFWLARAHLESGRSGVDMCRFVQQAEKHARAADDRLLLYLALCQKGASLLGAGDAGLLDEIGALQAGDWPPRVLCQRFLAEFTVLSLQERWTRALQAARAGLALGLDAGATHPTSVFANWTIVALFCLGDLDAALEQSRQMHPHIAAGPAGSTIPYLGTCARIALNRGDVAGARQQLARMFDLCRSVEWMNFEVFGDLYAELALAEGRATEAARLLGFATSAGERAWGVARSSRTRDHIRGTLERLLGVTAVLRLASEGDHMDPESVCGAVLPHAEASHT